MKDVFLQELLKKGKQKKLTVKVLKGTIRSLLHEKWKDASASITERANVGLVSFNADSKRRNTGGVKY